MAVNNGWKTFQKENCGSVNMVRKEAIAGAGSIIIDVSIVKTRAFTASDFGLSVISGGFVTSDDTFPISFMVTSTGCQIETAGTADVVVGDNVAITVFGK